MHVWRNRCVSREMAWKRTVQWPPCPLCPIVRFIAASILTRSPRSSPPPLSKIRKSVYRPLEESGGKIFQQSRIIRSEYGESKGKFWNQFWRNREIRYFLPLRRNLVAFYSEFLNYFTFTVGSTELWFQRDLYTGKLAKHVTSERKFSRSFSF